MKYARKSIWYADEQRANSPLKILVYNDKGSINVNEQGLHFHGATQTFSIDQPLELSLQRQTLNWGSYLIGGAIMVFLDLVIGSGMSAYFDTAWVLTKLYVLVAPLCILIFWYPVKWLVVHYTHQGQPSKAYFSIGDLSGLKAMLGANAQMQRAMVEQELAAHHSIQ